MHMVLVFVVLECALCRNELLFLSENFCAMGKSKFINMPIEIQKLTFQHLSPKSRKVCRLVCKKWKEIIESCGLFKCTSIVLDIGKGYFQKSGRILREVEEKLASDVIRYVGDVILRARHKWAVNLLIDFLEYKKPELDWIETCNEKMLVNPHNEHGICTGIEINMSTIAKSLKKMTFLDLVPDSGIILNTYQVNSIMEAIVKSRIKPLKLSVHVSTMGNVRDLPLDIDMLAAAICYVEKVNFPQTLFSAQHQETIFQKIATSDCLTLRSLSMWNVEVEPNLLASAVVKLERLTIGFHSHRNYHRQIEAILDKICSEDNLVLKDLFIETRKIKEFIMYPCSKMEIVRRKLTSYHGPLAENPDDRGNNGTKM